MKISPPGIIALCLSPGRCAFDVIGSSMSIWNASNIFRLLEVLDREKYMLENGLNIGRIYPLNWFGLKQDFRILHVEEESPSLSHSPQLASCW